MNFTLKRRRTWMNDQAHVITRKLNKTLGSTPISCAKFEPAIPACDRSNTYGLLYSSWCLQFSLPLRSHILHFSASYLLHFWFQINTATVSYLIREAAIPSDIERSHFMWNLSENISNWAVLLYESLYIFLLFFWVQWRVKSRGGGGERFFC